MNKRVCVALVSGVMAAAAGCGSSSSGGPTTNPATPSPTSPSLSGGGFPSSYSPGAASSSGGSHQLAVTGAFSASGTESSSSGCATQAGVHHNDADATVYYGTSGTSGPAGSYEVDLSYAPDGKTTTIPVTHAPVTGGISVRFSYHDDATSDYLDWGYSASPQPDPQHPNKKPAPSTATGMITISADGSSGSYDLTLPFAGDDHGSIAAGSKPAVKIVGSFVCS